MVSQELDETSRTLLQLGGLIQTSIANYVAYRHAKPEQVEGTLPSKPLFDAQRALLAASGLLTELVSEPQNRLLEVSSQYFEARALHVVADKQIPDILAKHENGLDVKTLAAEVGIESRKLARLMRCLCSIHLFKETAPDVFANNAITASLVDNEPLRSYILLFALDLYSSSDYLPRYLSDPVKGQSYDVDVTPWQGAVGTTKPRWDWLEEKVKVSDLVEGRNGSDGGASAYPGPYGTALEKAVAAAILEKTNGKVNGDADGESLVSRPEHSIFGLAMLGGGRVYGQAQLYDFPWASLGSATIVDIGGGVGSFCLSLSHLYPDLQFVVQDRAPVLRQAETQVWPKEHPAALEAGRVRFVPHDMFGPQPIKNAEVYWLRYIMHDWSDDYCITILSAIKSAMGPRSRILICDQVMNTTLGSPELPPAPAPLPANWGYYTRYSHQRDLCMLSIINGIERKPSEFEDIIQRAGLKLRKIWDCRSQVGLVEVVLPDSELA
ncbi:S-adenosyl-L-methionine-dependent methyltransferase [Bombardia bombarda]|uniref:S-adenosyl-L-methionine-dependent methyltransferase n=1 Tax=Bombardia bombarda TaxID=252184 RepID=A0AA40BVQ2_9PEZI|nr:S-adenosyl-L-methionine-dependent methyltransferase [Bombardia bombarda]